MKRADQLRLDTAKMLRKVIHDCDDLKQLATQALSVAEDSVQHEELSVWFPKALQQVRRIQEETAQYFGCSPIVLHAKTRATKFVFFRHIAMYLCTRHTSASSVAIGRAFKRDHSTVLAGVKRIQEGWGTNPDVKRAIQAIEDRLDLPYSHPPSA